MRQRIVTTVMRPEFWLLGLLFWLLLSAGRSLGTPWARVALTEALRWGAGIGLALALGAFFRHTKLAARFVVTLAGGIALLGIADGLRPSGGGMTGPYQDHQLYGSVLLLLLPPVVAVSLTARDARWRLAGIAAVGVGALCLALSQTRSAWAGGGVAALVFGCLWLLRSSNRRRDGRRILAAAAALAGASLALWLFLTPLDLRAPLTARAGTLSRLDTDSSWQERLTLWRGAAQMAAAHPLVGIGLGRYPGAQWAWTRTGSPLSPLEHPSLSEEAHDFYLQTADETGLIGLGLYLTALAAFVRLGLVRLRRTRRHRSPSQDALVIASLSVVAGQAVDALASPSWQFAEASLLFWALIGIGLAAMRGEEPEPSAVRVPPPLRRAGRLALSGGVAVGLAANVLPLGLLTPVQAYDSPAGWTIRAQPTLTPGTTTVTSGQTITYKLVAHYLDGGGVQRDIDVTNDSTTVFAAATAGGTNYTQDFNYQGKTAKNVFTAPSVAQTVTLSVSSYYVDKRINAFLNQSYAAPTILINIHASP